MASVTTKYIYRKSCSWSHELSGELGGISENKSVTGLVELGRKA